MNENTFNFPLQVAYRVMDLLVTRKAMLHQVGCVFYVWERDERVIVAFDPAAIDLKRVNDDFAHELSTRLRGRLVVRTNSRGLFLQVGYEVPSAPQSLDAQPLDLTKQPTPWHIPVGTTQAGPLWVDLIDADSILVGGSRGGGKTGEVHGFIQALLHGGKTEIFATDGKQGVEFGAYAVHPRFHFYLDSVKMLDLLREVLLERQRALVRSGYPNIIMHNAAMPADQILPIALVVDEAADLPDQAKETLKSMIRLFRHLGLHPIIATNQPTVADVFAKTNLSTRVAFRVPHHNDSVTMLGYKGAEALPDERGRGLIVWRGKFVQFQSFVVTYPTPTEETRQLITSQAESSPARSMGLPVDEITELAERIQDQWQPGMSKSAVSRLLGKAYAGSSWTAKVAKVITKLEEIAATASTTTTENQPEAGTVAV